MRTPERKRVAAGRQEEARRPSGVVVGYDGSSSAGVALAWAAAEAARRGSALTLLFAADVDAVRGEGSVISDELVTEAASQVIDEAVERLRREGSPGLDLHPEVRLGRPTDALVEASRGAELLVVGNRGRGAFTSALLGSVAFSTAARARCPVVVVREDPGRCVGPSCPVVVGVDGSPGAAAAVRFAATAAEAAGAPLTVVAAWTTPEMAVGDAVVPSYGEAVQAAARQSARNTADEAVAEVRRTVPGVAVEAVVVEDSAPRALAVASRDAALVVVGARGHGRLGGLFLGSVSHATIHTAHCPVAVVRPPRD